MTINIKNLIGNSITVTTTDPYTYFITSSPSPKSPGAMTSRSGDVLHKARIQELSGNWDSDNQVQLGTQTCEDATINNTDIISLYGGQDCELTTIADFAFYNCDNLISVTIPGSVESIGQYAFSYCTSIRNIIIPSNVKIIGTGTFDHCEKLEYVTIQPGITTINESTFAHCYELRSITFPNTVTSIGYSAFEANAKLQSISLPSVTSIGSHAFRFCTSLTFLVIPSISVETVESNYLSWCIPDGCIVQCSNGVKCIQRNSPGTSGVTTSGGKWIRNDSESIDLWNGSNWSSMHGDVLIFNSQESTWSTIIGWDSTRWTPGTTYVISGMNGSETSLIFPEDGPQMTWQQPSRTTGGTWYVSPGSMNWDGEKWQGAGGTLVYDSSNSQWVYYDIMGQESYTQAGNGSETNLSDICGGCNWVNS